MDTVRRGAKQFAILSYRVMDLATSSMIVFDGIAGSGKTTAITAVKKIFQEQEAKIFDLATWAKDHRDPPTFEDVKDYDVLFTFEPTKQWVGSAIRYEMSQTQKPYSGTALAHAFSLDRLVQYRRLILPARQAGKIIVQDRSVTSSIVYQPIMPDGPELKDLLEMPGNELAVKHAPDLIILTQIDPKLVASRHTRDDDSKGVFEDINLLTRVQERFHSDWFMEIFTKNGTTFEILNTELSLEETKLQAIDYVQTYLGR